VEGTSSKETAARIKESAAALGYIVDGVASSLRSRLTHTVGLVIADVSNPWWGQLVGGVESVLGPQGFSVILANTDNNVTREREAVATLLRQQVEAMIVASSASDSGHLQTAIARGTPIVLVDAELPGVRLDTITIDNRKAARMAVEHLISFGHERIAIVGGGTQGSVDVGRFRGYQDALEARGLPVLPELVRAGFATFEGGRSAVLELATLPNRPSAIFVTNNVMTVGALVAIAESGMEVPGEVSIIAIDDMEWYPIAHPPITAVYEPAREMGRRAAERLLLRLRRQRQPRVAHIRVETEFRIRESVGPPSVRKMRP
jgi:LacI family transcriptional regulator